MIDYNQITQSQQHQNEIAKRANAPEAEGWTHPVPNIFDKLFAALKPAKRTQSLAHPRTVTKPTLATK